MTEELTKEEKELLEALARYLREMNPGQKRDFLLIAEGAAMFAKAKGAA